MLIVIMVTSILIFSNGSVESNVQLISCMHGVVSNQSPSSQLNQQLNKIRPLSFFKQGMAHRFTITIYTDNHKEFINTGVHFSKSIPYKFS